MNGNFPRLRPMGERAILIEFEPEISPALLDRILGYKEVLEKLIVEEEVEVINTYNSLLVIYASSIEDVYGRISGLTELLKEPKIDKKVNSTLFHIPVCYDEKSGLDLSFISEEKKMPVEEIIRLHTEPIYTVFFIGFLPGFLYLGGMDKRLQISRKDQPRLEVPKGAVGIGENQTGIYPKKSPGGWQIIGNSPVNFFDKNSDPPSAFSAGDLVKFYAVSTEEYDAISEDIKSGTFTLKREKYVG